MRDVTYITDDGYFLPTKISILSILRNARDARVTIHIVAVALSDANRQAFIALGNENVTILIHDVPQDLGGLRANHVSISDAALLKPRLPSILPELDRVLFVDGDTILLPGFLDIFTTDLADVYAAVVMDMVVMRNEKWYKDFGLSHYFNSGVMYLNLRKMREDRIEERFVSIFQRDDVPKNYCEQCALNAAFGKDVLLLGLKYNFLTNSKSSYDKKDVLAFYDASPGDYDAPAILHYAAHPKPWEAPFVPDANIWLEYVPREDQLPILWNYSAAFRKRNELYQGQFRRPALLGTNLIDGTTDGVLLSGFAREEKWGRWTYGTASIRVRSDDFTRTDGNLLLYMRMRSFHAPRNVRLVFNGKLVHEMDVPAESTKIIVKIPKSVVRGDNLLEIQADGVCMSPRELGIGRDGRKLCLGVEYVRFAHNIGGALASIRTESRAAVAAHDAALAEIKAEVDRLRDANAQLQARLDSIAGNFFLRACLWFCSLVKRLFPFLRKADRKNGG